MLPHGLDVNVISGGSFNEKVLASLRSHIVGGRLRLIDRNACFQSAHRTNRECVAFRGIVTQTIGNPEIG